MNVAVTVDKDVAARIDAALLEKPDGILEMVAGKCEASLWQVFQRLPEGQAVAIAGDRFEELWASLTTWGTVLFIVHTEDIVLECEGALAARHLISRLFQYPRRQPHRRPYQGQQLRPHRFRGPRLPWAALMLGAVPQRRRQRHVQGLC